MSWFNSRIYSKKAKLQINFSTCDLRYKDSKNRKIELYILIYIVYYLYIYNNTGKCSGGAFLGRCNHLPYSELSAFGECSTMRSAKRRFFIPQMEALNPSGRASV